MSAFPKLLIGGFLTLSASFANAEEKKRPSGSAGIQADGFALLSVNVAHFWDAKEAKAFHAGMAKIKTRLTKDIRDEFGIGIEGIERVTYYWTATVDEDRQPRPFRFVTARKPFDRAKIIEKLHAQTADQITDPKFKEQAAALAGKNVYFKYEEALIFADDRTLIISPYIRDADVEVSAFLKVLGGTTPKVDKGPLAETLAGFEKHAVVAAIDFSRIRTMLDERPAPKGFESLVALTQAERALFTFDFGPTVRAGVEALYKKIDLTKAWDDPVNKKFAERTPDVFQYFGRGPEEKGATYFQMLTSAEPLEGGSPVLVTGRKISLISLTDGTSNTLMVAEGATAVNWLKPGDIPYDPKKRPQLGDPKTGKFLAGMGDGRVRRIDYKKLSDETLHNLIRIDDGNPLSDDFD